MTCQTYSLFVLSVIMIYFGRFGNSLILAQLQNDIDQLKADFNSSHSDVADGGPIFTEKLINWTERNEKRIILSQIVSMYLEILQNADKSKAHVRHISEELSTLKDSLPDGLKKMKDLMDLTKLQMSDLKIQRKAVNELFSVLKKLLETSTSLKRKRSQSQRRCKC
ncbi:interferon gamma [Grus americana]|uniref:Interferon gamma n=2 Tax=Gruidae TaxID=9109 RepID=A0A087VHU4_BALRE|nr:PREDICTED: interferon gamma [Balearica regulorum gibbericeps]XP_054702255.1 interferon gamma [Grus americana]KFO12186.1 Interferon gamma [Balearica regulorum gibbericeps]NWH23240.1 IFNG protein [Grus americana]